MMKQLSTPQMMTQLSAPLCSSKLFLSVSFSRMYTIDRSLVQLSEDIDFVYNDVTTNSNYSLSREELTNIHIRILCGLYVLSPLEVQYISKDYIQIYLVLLRTENPDFMVFSSKDPELFTVVQPDRKDVLVFMGLSIMLYRISHGSLPKDGYRMTNLVEPFYDSIRDMGMVGQLYNLKLDYSLFIITKSRVLEKVKAFVGEGSVCYNLISSFLNISAFDKDGNLVLLGSSIPLVGDITRVLFDIVLMDFDREFAQCFPGIVFTRCVGTVYFSIKGDDEIFDENVLHSLLEEIGLAGEITSIEYGDDEPFQCNSKLIYLDSDSKVVVCNRDDI